MDLESRDKKPDTSKFSQFDPWWNSARAAAGLVVISTGASIWALLGTPSVGVSIGILGGIGVLMTTREKMRPWEKAVYIICITALLIAEISAIRRNDREEKQARDVQIASLADLRGKAQQNLTDTNSLIQQGKDQFSALDQQGQGIAASAARALESITGGRSYPFVIPATTINPGFRQDSSFSMWISNAGNDPLSGVAVSVGRVTREEDKQNHIQRETDSGPMREVSIGSLGPHVQRLIPYLFINPVPFIQNSNTGHYVVLISAQNGTIEEDIYFRMAKSGVGWAYSALVEKIVNDKHQKIKAIDWTEPITQR